MTARRLRAFRPEVKKPYRAPAGEPRLDLAPGHYDGDGCTFPDPRHHVVTEASR